MLNVEVTSLFKYFFLFECAVAYCHGFLVFVYETFQIKYIFSLVVNDLFNHSLELLEPQMELLTYAMRFP